MTIANGMILSILIIAGILAIYGVVLMSVSSNHEKEEARIYREYRRKLRSLHLQILWIDIKQAWRKLDYHADKLFKRKKPK